MPSVWLDDNELVEMILERPHLITTAIEQLQKQHTEEVESWNSLYATISKQREEIKELKKLVDNKQS